MKIVAAGGGSGGHVTPVLAVINELNKHDPALQVHFICDKGFLKQSKDIMSRAAVPVMVSYIMAGKWRRYHGIPFLKQFFYWPTLSGNVKDFFTLGIGFLQSVGLLLRNRPDVVFTKGGFVCVPVGLAAAILRIPLVIHDSDAHPGLTNRILSRYARFIATGAPLKFYSYPKARSYYVGIPISSAYMPTSEAQRRKIKHSLGLVEDRSLVAVTGGGGGALPINKAVSEGAKAITKMAQVVHLTGLHKAEAVAKSVGKNDHYHVYEFVDQTKMAQIICAADVVVTRAGASTLLELAAAAKATIIVPNPRLTNGHQLKNAAVYKLANAAIVLNDDDIQAHHEHLTEAIMLLLNDNRQRAQLEKNIHILAKPHAAEDVAKLLMRAHEKQ
ncbi:MAG TPA: glycosyltransferase [Candidatus Saccharimonadales bacterium]